MKTEHKMKTGLIGYPIEHSLSPVIHNAAYAELGLAWNYALYPCPSAADFLQTIAEAQEALDVFVGFNVTTPYKINAYEACAAHSRFSRVAGSVNVLTLFADALSDGPSLRGDNTDGYGLVASLEHEGGARVAGSSVVLCGTGPVALSALLALIELKAASICVASRDIRKGQERLRLLCSRLGDGGDHGQRSAPTSNACAPSIPQRGNDPQAFCGETDEPLRLPEMRVVDYAKLAACLETADILIDATPVGMTPTDGTVVPLAALRPGLVVLDAVYGHRITALIRGARERGVVAIDGLGMLVEQAALTIEIWARTQNTPIEAPRELMYECACREAARRFL
jgi:shikimate dehydrogenase